MSEKWTIEQYRQYLKGAKSKREIRNRGDKAKEHIYQVLWDITNNLDKHPNMNLRREYRFNPDRRWRSDWALWSDDEKIKILIEYEGLAFIKTGHTSSKGYTANTEKYNSAQALGWKVLRFTYLNYQTIEEELKRHL